MSAALLTVQALAARLPDTASAQLCDVSFELDAGQYLALVGASGSGKSLSALALLGLLPPGTALSGSIRYAGQEMLGAAPAQWRALRGRGIGLIAQDASSNLHPLRGVGAQIAETAQRQQALSRRQARVLALDLLARVGIAAAEQRYADCPQRLSGGQRQRASIACALAARPRILIADEATSALDAGTARQIARLLDDLRREQGLALLFITHDLALAARCADRIAVMEHGRIVECAPSAALLRSPNHARGVELLATQREQPPPRANRVPTGDPLIEVEGLSASYRSGAWLLAKSRPVLTQVSFQVMPGEVLALVGESGSGKSTLARCLLGLLPPSAGSIRCAGRNLAHGDRRAWQAARRQLQMVFQDPSGSLDPRLRVVDALLEALAIHRLGHGREERKARALELLAQVGLGAEHMARFPHQLSGGQCQRVAIARALAVGPRCLVCDEATSALDVVSQRQVLDLLRQFRDSLGLSLLLISHDLALVRAQADRVGVLYGGRLVEMQTTEALFRDPQHSYTRELLVCAGVFDAP